MGLMVASPKYGTAKKANLYSYKVDIKNEANEDCILKALQQINGKVKERKTKSGYKGSVVNLSSNLPASDNLETRIELLVQQNVAVVTNPGNDNDDSKTVFPCAYEGVICVGGVDKNYDRWEESSSQGSGFGAKVTLWAPGVDVTSYNNKGVVDQFTGVSFATPLVAGIVATYYDVKGPTEPALVVKRLNDNAEMGILSRLKSKNPNVLANNGYQKAGENDYKPYIGAPPKAGTHATSTATPTASPSPSPTSKVMVAFDYRGGTYDWDFFTAPITQTSFDFCKPYTSHTITPLPTVAASVALPTGTFSIGEVGQQHQENGCIYTNQGHRNGSMSCDGAGGFDCEEISSSKYNKDGGCTDNAAIEWRIQCSW